MQSTAQLVVQARDPALGRPLRHAAFTRLVERFQDMVYGMAWAAIGDSQQAQDLAQDIFLAAYLDLSNLVDPVAFPGWLRRLAQRQCGRARPVPLPEDLPAPQAEADPETAWEKGQRHAALHQALQALPQGQRQVLVLFYLGDYPQREIADFLGLSLAAVKKRVQRAKTHLQEAFTAMLADDLSQQRPSRTPRFGNQLLDMLHAAEPQSAFAATSEKEKPYLAPLVGAIRTAATELAPLSAAELAGHSQTLRQRAQKDALDELLPRAYAVVIEAQKRRNGSTWADAQLVEAILLHHGQAVALARPDQRLHLAALPLYLNAVSGRGAHFLATAEKARRAADELQPLFRDLALTAAYCQEKDPLDQDLSFCPLDKIGFDFLRHRLDDQRPAPRLHYALIDRVEHLLIEHHATPLVLSRPARDWSATPYRRGLEIARALLQAQETHADGGEPLYIVNGCNVEILAPGQAFLQDHSPDLAARAPNALLQLLRGLVAYQPGRDYTVHKGRIVILEKDGTLQFNRRFSEGLHQALEAKEGVEIHPETQTLATIRYRDFFQLYQRLAGLVVGKV